MAGKQPISCRISFNSSFIGAAGGPEAGQEERREAGEHGQAPVRGPEPQVHKSVEAQDVGGNVPRHTGVQSTPWPCQLALL